jgi:hypothetical protein
MTGPDTAAEVPPAGEGDLLSRRDFLKLSGLLPAGWALDKILPKGEVKDQGEKITKEQVRRQHVFEGMKLYGRVLEGEVLFNVGQKETVAMALALDEMQEAVDKETSWKKVISGVVILAGVAVRVKAGSKKLSKEEMADTKKKLKTISNWLFVGGGGLLLDVLGDMEADVETEEDRLELTGAEGKLRLGVINQALGFMELDAGMATIESTADLVAGHGLASKEVYIKRQLFLVSQAIDSIIYNNNKLLEGEEVVSPALKYRMEAWEWAGERAYSRDEIIDLVIKDPVLREALRNYEKLPEEERKKDDPFGG